MLEHPNLGLLGTGTHQGNDRHLLGGWSYMLITYSFPPAPNSSFPRHLFNFPPSDLLPSIQHLSSPRRFTGKSRVAMCASAFDEYEPWPTEDIKKVCTPHFRKSYQYHPHVSYFSNPSESSLLGSPIPSFIQQALPTPYIFILRTQHSFGGCEI